MLDKELSTFEKVKVELRAKHPQGGFVVIKDEEVFGVWMDRNDAIKEAMARFGNVQFLVKNIEDCQEFKINFSRNIQFTTCHS